MAGNLVLLFSLLLWGNVFKGWSRSCIVWFWVGHHFFRWFIERFDLFLLYLSNFNFGFLSSTFCAHNFINQVITFDFSLGSSLWSLCLTMIKFNSNHFATSRVFKDRLIFLFGFRRFKIKPLLANEFHSNLWTVFGISSWRDQAAAL